jgi:hypothetical protein
MCEVRSREKKPKTKTTKYNYQSPKKKMYCDEPHLVPNEETHPIKWTKGRTCTSGRWFTLALNFHQILGDNRTMQALAKTAQ